MDQDIEVFIRFRYVADAKVALDAQKWRGFAQDFDEYLRQEIKWGQHPPKAEDTFQRIRDEFYKRLEEEGLALWD